MCDQKIPLNKIRKFYIIANHNDKVNQRHKSKNSLRKILLAFSWRKNFTFLMNNDQFDRNEIAVVCGVQVMCLLWIILIHTCTVLFYVSGKWSRDRIVPKHNLLQPNIVCW